MCKGSKMVTGIYRNVTVSQNVFITRCMYNNHQGNSHKTTWKPVLLPENNKHNVLSSPLMGNSLCINTLSHRQCSSNTSHQTNCSRELYGLEKHQLSMSPASKCQRKERHLQKLKLHQQLKLLETIPPHVIVKIL